MKTLPHFAIVLLLFSLPSCSEDSQLPKYEFYIEGVVDGRLLRYPQVNTEDTNVSNRYFVNAQETWLQAYRSSTDYGAGHWDIRIHDTSIETVSTPYSLPDSSGSISWFDPRVDNIIANNPACQGIDTGCGFFLLPENSNEITITSVQDSVIEGHFSGKMIMLGTGFSPFRDTTLFHTVRDGFFRIKYRLGVEYE